MNLFCFNIISIYNIKLSNSQINKLKSVVIGNLSLNMIGNSIYETNFPNKLLLTDTKVSSVQNVTIRKVFRYTFRDVT